MNIPKSIVLMSFMASSLTISAQDLEKSPVPVGPITEMAYTLTTTQFSVWAPTAQEARVNLYDSAIGGNLVGQYALTKKTDGTWQIALTGNFLGRFYTFQIKTSGKWNEETPGIFAKAVGTNGQRAQVIDMKSTNPAGWDNDTRPILRNFSDVVIYEMHHRDFSMCGQSGMKNKGKFLALTETGTQNKTGLSTGLDHLKDLGVNHVHILPSYDYGSVDETRLNVPQYNWGYDPVNYNVPEGSYSTNPADPSVRIREFKQMVQSLHQAGIRVVLDVVYNHVFDAASSQFQKTVPDYFFRHKPDGKLSDGSGCGNETASEMPMMRKYMVESVLYWIKEYHIDGFRFDLMGVHDIETMNAIRQAVDSVDPSIFIYGEGWAASSPALPENKLAMKANSMQMPGIAAFGDEMRDGLRGPWTSDEDGAFVIGKAGNEMSVKFGVVGAIQHPQIDYTQVNYSKEPWALQPTQMISYVSCHDDMCLADRIKATTSDGDEALRIRLHKLAESVVLTSQGVPFIWCGDEMMRDKKGVHNSYNSPDSINTIPWGNKTKYKEVYDYMKSLLALRKAHPAFHMGDADMVRRHLEFLPVKQQNLVAYQLKEHAAGDPWENIIVVYNSNPKNVKIDVPVGTYTVVCRDGEINENGLGQFKGAKLTVPAQSTLIMYK